MKLTKAGEYAIRCVLYLAQQPKGHVSLLEDIHKKQCSPKHLTAKVLRRLVEGGLVKSMRGTGGGYRLAKPASEISTLDVIECIEGKISLNVCMNEGECSNVKSCSVHPVWVEAQEKLKEILHGYNFSALAEKLKD